MTLGKVCHIVIIIVVIIDVVIVMIVVFIVASQALTFINPQTVKVLSAAPPGTPIAVFLEKHKEEMELAMRQSQLMVTSASRIAYAPHMSIPEKFSALREHFGAREPTREETEKDISDLRRKNDVAEPEMPRPRVPVFLLTVAEAQLNSNIFESI